MSRLLWGTLLVVNKTLPANTLLAWRWRQLRQNACGSAAKYLCLRQLFSSSFVTGESPIGEADPPQCTSANGAMTQTPVFRSYTFAKRTLPTSLSRLLPYTLLRSLCACASLQGGPRCLNALAFHCGRPQQLHGLRRSRVAAVPCVFHGRYSCA